VRGRCEPVPGHRGRPFPWSSPNLTMTSSRQRAMPRQARVRRAGLLSPDVEAGRQLVDEVQEVAGATHERVEVAAGGVVDVLPWFELDVLQLQGGDARRQRAGLVWKVSAQAAQGRCLLRRFGVLAADPPHVLTGQGDDDV